MNRISQLLLKRLTGKLSAGEAAELDAWIAGSEANRQLFNRLSDPAELKKHLDRWHMVDSARACGDMQRRVNAILWRGRLRRCAAAAAVLAVIGVSVWLMRHDGAATESGQVLMAENVDSISVADIKPGVTRALLSDAAGHKVLLQASDTAVMSAELLAVGAGRNIGPESLCLDVPRGGEFKIQLEDGTEVWLNSDSRLYYPNTFADSVRRVRVEGEAYFAVASDSVRPFYVTTGSQEVRVYGTTFNVRSYPEEAEVYTTLESGSVSIGRADHIGGTLHLTPGHQAVFNPADARVNIKEVDTEVVTSWRKGRFVFENQTLLRIMQDLSRWYDFEYEFTDPSLKNEEFMGSIPRYADFTTAIAILEKCGGISFTMSDGNVIISKKQ